MSPLADLDLPDLGAVLASQKDLKRLLSGGCTNRSVENELFWPNRNYGFSWLLKAQAGWSPSRPLPGVMPHGVRLDLFGAASVHPYDLHPELRTALAYPGFVERAYARSVGIEAVLGICSPFLYALQEFERRFRPPEDRSGTIFFPRHSTAAKKVRSPYGAIAEVLRSLPEPYQPVRICVHWQDAKDGLSAFFRERGFTTLCCGGLHDNWFLFRLLHLLSTCRYCCSQVVTSNTFYALAAGVETFLLPAPVEILVDRRFPQPQEEAAATGLRAQLHQQLATPESSPGLGRKRLTLAMLGSEKRKNSHDLLVGLETMALQQGPG